MLAGRVAPELGGSPEILDIVGVNVYHYSQVQLDADKKRETLGPRDPRRKPLSELLKFAWDRYQSADHHRRDERLSGQSCRMAADDHGRIIEGA